MLSKTSWLFAVVLGSSALLACSQASTSKDLPLEDDTAGRGRRTTEPGATEDIGAPGTETPPETVPVPVAAVKILVDNQKHPRGVAVDSAFVYYSSMDDKAIYKVPVTGGAAVRVDSGGAAINNPWVQAVDDTYVYFINTALSGPLGSVARVAKAGGPSETIVANVRPWGFTATATTLFFTDQSTTLGSIRKVAKSCTLPCTSTLVAGGQEFPIGLATDGTFVYWTNQATVSEETYPGGPSTIVSYEGSLRRWDVNSTSSGPEATPLMVGLKDPSGVAVGGGRVFLSTMTDGKVRAVSTSGLEERFISSGSPRYMTADETHVYWLSGGAGSSKAIVYRAKKNEGAPDALAIDQNGPVGIAVGSDAVYWANLDGGQIMRAAKP